MNKFQIQMVYPQTAIARGFLMLALAATVVLSGCRQPVTNHSGQPSLFGFSRPKLFGGGSSANEGSGSRYAYNPDLQRSPLGGDISAAAAQQQYAGISNEVQRLNQRLGAYDSDNQLLNTEVAGLQQKLQLANQYNQTLKDQLGDTSSRVQIAELEKQTALQQMASLQMQVEQIRTAQQQQQTQRQQADARAARYASSSSGQTDSQNRLASYSNGSNSKFSSGATIRANNSLMQQLSNISIPGGQARMDGDVIRVEFPTDRMFVPGTYQIQPSQLPVLQNIAATIRQNFTKQIIGIEAHWDGTPLNPSTTTDHQLTATQALAVFDNLVRLGLPKSQLFTMAMASNRPRHPRGPAGGVNPNRRIELVIYPETYDGSY